jgi:hypothetical protein
MTTDLSSILGNIGGADLENMVTNFNQGQHDQVPDQQLQDAHSQVAAQLPQDQYVQAARDAFQKLTPEQRDALAKELQTQAQQQGITVPSAQTVSSDPGSLANAVGDITAQGPNVLQQMFAPGGLFSSPIAKAALLGITAMAAQRLMPARR